jgi:hypothetical protein
MNKISINIGRRPWGFHKIFPPFWMYDRWKEHGILNFYLGYVRVEIKRGA